MKSYSHIVQKMYEPLLITPARWAALAQLLEARLERGLIAEEPQPKVAGGITVPRAMDDDDDGYSGSSDDDSAIKRDGSVAIIPVYGTLVMHPEDIAMSECGCAMENLSAMIDVAERDSRIETVIYDFRTPGGSVTGIPEVGRKIRASRKNTVGYTESECCSGGIWLAAQCQEFFGTQSSRIGSVGVYCMTLDMSAALKEQGVKVNAISAGKYKLLGASFKPLTTAERAILQGGVDKIYAQFKQAMESFRVCDDVNYGNGLVFDGEEAAERGLTNGVVESLDEVLENLD